MHICKVPHSRKDKLSRSEKEMSMWLRTPLLLLHVTQEKVFTGV